jgi:hypothetical protein
MKQNKKKQTRERTEKMKWGEKEKKLKKMNKTT